MIQLHGLMVIIHRVTVVIILIADFGDNRWFEAVELVVFLHVHKTYSDERDDGEV